MNEKPLLCTVYRGARKQDVYLYVDRREGLERVPAEVQEVMGDLSEVMTIRLTSQRRLARADPARVLSEISEKGYFLQLPPVPGAELVNHE